MSLEVKIAVIATVSALGGSLIGVVGSIVLQKITQKYEFYKELRQPRSPAYCEFVESMQEFMNNNTSEDAYKNFYTAINKIKIFASNDVAAQVSSYYMRMILDQENPLTGEEHKKYQTDITNSIRTDLNVCKSRIPDLSFVSYRPNR